MTPTFRTLVGRQIDTHAQQIAKDLLTPFPLRSQRRDVARCNLLPIEYPSTFIQEVIPYRVHESAKARVVQENLFFWFFPPLLLLAYIEASFSIKKPGKVSLLSLTDRSRERHRTFFFYYFFFFIIVAVHCHLLS